MTRAYFLPGLNNDALTLRDVVAALPEDMDGHALDLPIESDLDALADRVADQVDPGSVVVGHSFGGVVAMTLAERHPERVAGLVLVNTPWDTDTAGAAQRRRERAEAAFDGEFEDMAMGRLELLFHGARAEDPDVRSERLRGVRSYGAERYRAHAYALSGRPDRGDFLRTISIPALIVAASHDSTVPVEGQQAWAEQNGVPFAEIADSAHMLPVEEPTVLAGLIGRWWADASKEKTGAVLPLPIGPLPDYEVHGNGTVTLFLLHGAYGDRRYFDDAIRRWTGSGLRVVAWNCPGYGSEQVPEDFGIPLAAEYAARMVLSEQTEVNVLLGHSMGGLIAPRLPALVGEALDGLILSAASAGFVNRSEEDKERYLTERVRPITEDGLSVAEYASELLDTMMAPGSSGPLVDRVVEVVTGMKTDAFLASMKAITEYNSVPWLEALRVPTLMLAGEHDPACTPAGMQHIQQLVPGAHYHEVSKAGHYAFAEKPEEYHQITTNFISTVAGHGSPTQNSTPNSDCKPSKSF